MRVYEALRPADAVVAGDEAALGKLGRLTPFEAVIPALKGFPIEPNCDLRPEARVATRLSAWRASSRVRPMTRAAATVAPKAPVVAV